MAVPWLKSQRAPSSRCVSRKKKKLSRIFLSAERKVARESGRWYLIQQVRYLIHDGVQVKWGGCEGRRNHRVELEFLARLAVIPLAIPLVSPLSRHFSSYFLPTIGRWDRRWGSRTAFLEKKQKKKKRAMALLYFFFLYGVSVWVLCLCSWQ